MGTLDYYLVVVLFFILRSVFILEAASIDLQSTRSRETRAQLRKIISRHQRELLYSLVWPFIVCRATLASIKTFIKPKDEKKSSS